MKKQFYLLTAGLLIVCVTHAQLKKGDILLGGNVNFITSTTSPASSNYTSNQTSYSISPNVARAVSDDLLVGLNLAYSHNKTKVGAPATISTQDGFGLGVFLRKYKTLGAGFALFAEGDLGGMYTLSRNYTDGGTKPPAGKVYTINAGFYPGIAYFVSKHVQLETGLTNLAYMQYSHSKSQEPVDVKSSSFSVGSGFNQALDNFVIGLKWVL
ncbi:MAG TPA: hypothetical protein VHD83_18565 [Puia sp.]|nr:hypothetical protein [Puia sp.]